MFQRVIDNFKDSLASAMRLTSLAAIAALALLVAIAFLCAAAFVYLLQRYGPIEACLAGAGFFFVITLILACIYAICKRRPRGRRSAPAPAAAPSSPLADPMVAALALQVIRAVGIKKVVPLLAIGGLALGLFASRNVGGPSSDDTPE